MKMPSGAYRAMTASVEEAFRAASYFVRTAAAAWVSEEGEDMVD